MLHAFQEKKKSSADTSIVPLVVVSYNVTRHFYKIKKKKKETGESSLRVSLIYLFRILIAAV